MSPNTTINTAQSDMRFKQAVKDLAYGLRRPELWFSLGWLEIQQRYRRSIIGPFWLTLSVGIFVAGLGIIYSNLFRIEIREYLPFLSLGIIIWTMISSMMIDGCTVFIQAQGIIKQLNAPISTHIYRLLWRTIIVFLHNIIIYFFVLVYFQINPGLNALMALPGIIIVSVASFGFALLLGVFSTRFRDIPPIAANFIQILFFITPVIWKPEVLSGQSLIVAYNPFYYLIEIVRAPLLGSIPPLSDWLIAMVFAVIVLMVALAIFVRFRGRIPYWL